MQALTSLNDLLKRSGVLNDAYRAAAAERAERISELVRENQRLAAEITGLRARSASLRKQLETTQSRLRKATTRERNLRDEYRALASRRSVRAALRVAAMVGARRSQPSDHEVRR